MSIPLLIIVQVNFLIRMDEHLLKNTAVLSQALGLNIFADIFVQKVDCQIKNYWEIWMDGNG